MGNAASTSWSGSIVRIVSITCVFVKIAHSTTSSALALRRKPDGARLGGHPIDRKKAAARAARRLLRAWTGWRSQRCLPERLLGIPPCRAQLRKFQSPGRPEEFHLQSPTDPYVSLSTHTARASHTLETFPLQGDVESRCSSQSPGWHDSPCADSSPSLPSHSKRFCTTTG